MIAGIHHIGVAVRDLDAAVAFYAAAFDFREKLRFDLPDTAEVRAMLGLSRVGGRAAMVGARNAMIELFQFDDAAERASVPPANQAGIGHFCVQGARMPELAGRFAAAGGVFHAPPTDLGADILYAYPRDPGGNIVELESIPEAAGETGMWIAHLSIATANIDRAVSFYEQLTGATARRSARIGPNPKIDALTGLADVEVSGAWLDVGNAQLELWQYHRPATGSLLPRAASDEGYSHIAFEVDDLPSERRRLEQMGMVFAGDPIAYAGAAATYGRDPDGNVVELIEFKDRGRRLSIQCLPDPGIVPRVEAARARGKAA
jgi:catechol 2,3-dioxygenase-like lactoylglutathione lyase family enzyme